MHTMFMSQLLVFGAVVVCASGILGLAIERRLEHCRELLAELDGPSNGLAFLWAQIVSSLPIAMIVMSIAIYLYSGAIVIPAVVLALVFVLPDRWLRRRRRRSRERIDQQLPGALSQVATSLRAGSTLVLALQSYAEDGEKPLADECARMLDGVRFGTPLGEALDELSRRVGSTELALSVAAIQVARESGGPLAAVLTRFAENRRRAFEMEARVRALTAQGVLQGRVVTALPYLVVIGLYLLEPTAMQPLHSSLLGWSTIALVVSLQCLGLWLIRGIVTVRI